jgi:hypothetical protein
MICRNHQEKLANKESRTNNRGLQREAFTISREPEYFTADELEKQTGYSRAKWWPAVIIKEAADNALDAAEQAGIAPEIAVLFEQCKLEIRDNGGGIPPEIVESLIDAATRSTTITSRRRCCRNTCGSIPRRPPGGTWCTMIAAT